MKLTIFAMLIVLLGGCAVVPAGPGPYPGYAAYQPAPAVYIGVPGVVVDAYPRYRYHGYRHRYYY